MDTSDSLLSSMHQQHTGTKLFYILLVLTFAETLHTPLLFPPSQQTSVAAWIAHVHL